jgi:hypothetical protein
MDIDQGKLDAFMGKMIGHMTGGMICYAVWLGDELAVPVFRNRVVLPDWVSSVLDDRLDPGA